MRCGLGGDSHQAIRGERPGRALSRYRTSLTLMPTEDAGTFFEGVDVLAGDEVVVEDTTALLRKESGPGGLGSWSGVVGVGFDAAFDLMDKNDLEIRLPGGRTGRIIVTGSSTDKPNVTVQGSGPAPF